MKQGELVMVGKRGRQKCIENYHGALHPTKSSITFENALISPSLHTNQRGLGYLYPQSASYLQTFVCGENLKLGAYILKDETVVNKNLDFIYDLFPRLKERRQQPSRTC